MAHKSIFCNTIWNTFTSKINMNLSARESNECMQLLANKVSDLAPIRSKYDSSYHCPPSFGIYCYQNESEQDDVGDEKITNDEHQHLLQLVPISCQNKIDLAQLLISQYHLSNLSLKEFISSSKLLAEICKHRHIDTAQKILVENMLINYLKAYAKYIEEPVPNTRNEFSRNFSFFDDKIDIILAYLSRINQFIGQYGLNQTRPKQFDIYFAPPSTSNDLDDLHLESMVKSAPNSRVHAVSGLNEIYSFLSSKSAEGLLGGRDNSRLILLIIRKNERNTRKDILYLFKQTLTDDMYNNPVYEYNEFLWKLNTKQDVIKDKLSVNANKYGTENNLFCVSYHLRPNKACKKYFYFNGYGEQLCKRHIFNKMPLLFENKDNKDQISVDIGFNDFIEANDGDVQFGQYIFGLAYSFRALSKTSRQQIITFPKNVLQNTLNQIAEFHEQSQLYYYLTWTHKMQMVDNLFLCYSFNDEQSKDIAIFNTELHDTTTQRELFAVAVPNDRVHGNRRNFPKWKMNNFMDAQQIQNIYGINPSHLPQGSRAQRSYFQHEIRENTESLTSHIYVHDWRHVHTIRSQQFKHRFTPRFNRSELNTAIKHSIGKIHNYELDLIPILNIDIKSNDIRVDSLIPVRIKNQWIAVSFKQLPIKPYKTVVTGLYIDCDDIINKASLIDAKALQTFQWLKHNPFNNRKSVNPSSHHQNNLPLPTLGTDLSAESNASNASNVSNVSNFSNGSLHSIQSIQSIQTNPKLQSVPNSDTDNNSLNLQQQLMDALRGNSMMTTMLKQKDEIIQQQYQQIQRLNQQLQAMQQQQGSSNQAIQSSAKLLPGNIMIPNICKNSPIPSVPNSAAISYNLNLGFPPIPPSTLVDILPSSRPGSRTGSPVPTWNLAYNSNSPPVTPPMPLNLTQSSVITTNLTGTQIKTQNNCTINIGRSKK